jgi:hypothetical protein
MMAALGPPRFALQPLGCHHGPWAGRKTHDPSGGGSVMYQYDQDRIFSSSAMPKRRVREDDRETYLMSSLGHMSKVQMIKFSKCKLPSCGGVSVAKAQTKSIDSRPEFTTPSPTQICWYTMF